MLRTYITDLLVVQVYDPEQTDEENDIEIPSEAGLNYVLLIPVKGRKAPLAWNISNMTMPELEATRQFFTRLFDLAEPVIRERDKVADDAFAEGDDSFARVYRDVPQVIDRERAFFENRQGVQHRSGSAADGHEPGVNPG